MIYAAVCLGKFVNRGFLNGPVCPIYGFGMLLVTVALMPLKRSFILLFIGSVLLTTALEFVVGFILEKFFGEKWWDYSDEPFNIKGYVCLKFSIIWGLGCVLVVDAVQPAVMKIIERSESGAGFIIAFIGIALMLTDTVLTVTATVRMKNRLHKLDEITAQMKVISDKIGGSLAEGTLTVMEKYEEGKAGLSEKKAELAGEIAEQKEKYQESIADAKRVSEQELAELKAKLRALTEHDSPISKRILNSYPRLQKGMHSESISRLMEYWNRVRDKKK